MHAFLLETSENPQKLDFKSIVPEQFDAFVLYEIETIDKVREFKKSWVYSPPTKTLCVISYLDTAKEEAQNAILKMLEEPTHHNLIFLILVQNQSKIITTILSRVTLIRQKSVQNKISLRETLTMESISKMTDRETAISLLQNETTEDALKTLEALKKNGNVILHLTNYLLHKVNL